MSLLRIKNADGTWTHVTAIAGKDGKDGSFRYTAGKGINITEDNVIENTLDVSSEVNEALNKVAKDLENYYTKSETYNKDEINSLLTNIKSSTVEVVATRPEVGEENVIYLVPKDPKNENVYNEWIYINSKWELIGSTEIDLSNYYTKTEINNLIGNLENLDTTDKGNLVDAINNAFNNLGIPELTTQTVELYTLDPGVYKLKGVNTLKYSTSNSYAINKSGNTDSEILINIEGGAYGNKSYLFSFSKIVEFTIEKYTEYSLYDFASKSEVLSKTNVVAYTPTNDYNPATKGYVDNAIANAELGGGGGTTFTEDDPIFTASAASTITSNDITSWNSKVNATEVLTRDNVSVYEPINTYNPATKGYVDSEVSKALGVDLSDYYTKEEVNQAIASKGEEDPVFKASPAHQITNENISAWNSKLTANEVLTKSNTAVYVPTSDYHPATKSYVDGLVSDIPEPVDAYSKTEVDTKLSSYLSKNNTTSYTPTADYHPATKKFVESAVAGIEIPTINLNNYYTKTEVDNKIDNIPTGVTNSTLSSRVKEINSRLYYTVSKDMDLSTSSSELNVLTGSYHGYTGDWNTVSNATSVAYRGYRGDIGDAHIVKMTAKYVATAPLKIDGLSMCAVKLSGDNTVYTLGFEQEMHTELGKYINNVGTVSDEYNVYSVEKYINIDPSDISTLTGSGSTEYMMVFCKKVLGLRAISGTAKFKSIQVTFDRIYP